MRVTFTPRRLWLFAALEEKLDEAVALALRIPQTNLKVMRKEL
jgi:hypothetical protein